MDITFEVRKTTGHIVTSALGIDVGLIGAAIVYFTKHLSLLSFCGRGMLAEDQITYLSGGDRVLGNAVDARTSKCEARPAHCLRVVSRTQGSHSQLDRYREGDACPANRA